MKNKTLLLLLLIALGLTLKSWAQTERSKVLFYDDFYDNAKNWPSGYTSDVIAEISAGFLKVDRKLKAGSSMLCQQVEGFNGERNFSIEAKIQHLSGKENAGMGLIFGRDSENYFEFIISSNGYYKINHYNTAGKSVIKPWEKCSQILTGKLAWNTLKVSKEGFDWKFHINGNYVYSCVALRFYGTLAGITIGNNQKIAIDYVSVKQNEPSNGYTQAQVRPTYPTYNAAPTIQIIEPENSRGFKAISRQFVHVVGRATDTDGIARVTVNNQQTKLEADGLFTIDLPLLSGTNNFVVSATDNTGKSAEMEFNVSQNISTPVATGEKRLALVIGNSSYSNAGVLTNPVNDARAMSAKLSELGFEVLKYEDCNQKQIKQAMDEFGEKLSQFDVGLFFYAGHGIQVDGRNYLVPVDARLKNKNDVSYDCVDASRILAKMESSAVKTNIVILDACRDNPYERSWSRSTKSSGLAFMNAPTGSFVAYSTAPGQTASDGSGKNGLYTEALLEHIATQEISIEEVFKRVRSSVKQKSDGKQIPWESTSLEGKFSFKR